MDGLINKQRGIPNGIPLICDRKLDNSAIIK